MSAQSTRRTILSQSVAICITGAVNSGKTFQILSLLTAEVDGEPIATPTLYLLAESSAEGTAGAVLNDPGRCCVWPVSDCDEALDAIIACFPDSGPLTLGEAKAAAYKEIVKRASAEHRVPPPPQPASTNDGEFLRSIVCDTMSTLYEGSKMAGSRLLKKEAGDKATKRAGKKGAPWNDPRNLGLHAASQCKDLIERLNSITAHHRGLIVLVTVHTCPAIEYVSGGEGEAPIGMAVGETPNLGAPKAVKAGLSIPAYSVTWNSLAAKMNIIWHCFEEAPNFGQTPRMNINGGAGGALPGSKHGVITMKGHAFPNIGNVLWPKRQGGDGPFAIFDMLPAIWQVGIPCDPGVTAISPGPSIGAVLAYAIKACRDGQSAG